MGAHFDNVEYVFINEVHIGMLLLIVETVHRHSRVKVAIVRWLRITEPHPANVRVVSRFRPTRYEYDFLPDSNSDIGLQCVFPSEIKLRVPIVPDMHALSILHSYSIVPNELPETATVLRNEKKLLLRGVQITALPPKN